MAKARSFLEGYAKCNTHGCQNRAEGWLLTPEGDPSGVSCQNCADLCMSEYREKLKEIWAFNTGTLYKESGNTFRYLAR